MYSFCCAGAAVFGIATLGTLFTLFVSWLDDSEAHRRASALLVFVATFSLFGLFAAATERYNPDHALPAERR